MSARGPPTGTCKIYDLVIICWSTSCASSPSLPVHRASTTDHPYFLSRVSNVHCSFADLWHEQPRTPTTKHTHTYTHKYAHTPAEKGEARAHAGWRRVLRFERGMKKGLPPPVFNSFHTFWPGKSRDEWPHRLKFARATAAFAFNTSNPPFLPSSLRCIYSRLDASFPFPFFFLFFPPLCLRRSNWRGELTNEFSLRFEVSCEFVFGSLKNSPFTLTQYIFQSLSSLKLHEHLRLFESLLPLLLKILLDDQSSL